MAVAPRECKRRLRSTARFDMKMPRSDKRWKHDRTMMSVNMKTKISQALPIIALGCSALLFSVTGCSRAPEIPPKEVTVQADDKMRYDLTAFDVKPGQKVVVTFKNIGTTPKFSMGHNFVMLDRTVNTGNVQTFLDKASTEAAHDYIPPDAKEVLAHEQAARAGRNGSCHLQRALCSGRTLYLCSFPVTIPRARRDS